MPRKKTKDTDSSQKKKRTPKKNKTVQDTSPNLWSRIMNILKRILIILLIIFVAVIVTKCGLKGFGFGAGTGSGGFPFSVFKQTSDDNSDNNEANTEVDNNTNVETISTEGVSSEVESDDLGNKTDEEQEIQYIEVTVNEDGYIYNNTKQELESIIADTDEGDVIRLKEHRAAKKDIDALLDAAKEKHVKVLREN